MLQRDFTQIDLRTMLDRASGYHPDFIEGRWVIKTHHRHRAWEVVVEPDFLAFLFKCSSSSPPTF